MTRLFDDPASFMEDMLDGFLDVHRTRVVGVPGGVVRAAETPPGKVAVVVGGGSGHYPAFCGVVGPGFADGAVVGNVFTSPSAEDAYSVGRAADNGGGVVFSTGNYAGDVMNFRQAQERLNAEGIDTRTVFVTDDIASAPAAESHKRRGIAGDFVVFKVAGAAADSGLGIDAVERLARKANDRTRSLGVAFAGCTMPGEDTPLFTVPEKHMGVGLGIHGEPGISEEAIVPAAELAERLVDGLLAELSTIRRAGAILNGLGGTKYEELFIVWRSVSRLLRERGVAVVEPEVGELVTSLDMAGCSLTLVDLDDELEQFWRAPADTPAYRKGAVAPPRFEGRGRRRERLRDPAATNVEVSEGDTSKQLAVRAFSALEAIHAAMRKAEVELGRIDAVAGDGDHGRGMVKGSSAAVDAARGALGRGAGVGSLLRAAGDAWAGKAGGTSGALWGAALRAVGRHLAGAAKDGDVRPEDIAAALRSGMEAISELGGAEMGDKTMLDAYAPFLIALDEAIEREALATAWTTAVAAAREAAESTAHLRPRVGRARPLAERSVGTPDAGATSLALALDASSIAVTGPSVVEEH